jgi:hypothetical protein
MPVTTKVTTISLATGVASAAYTFTEKYKKLILCATETCFININEATSSATTGFLIQQGINYEIPIMNPASISYIRSTANGRLTILGLL